MIYVELVRGVPLISVLFMATFLVPLFLPPALAQTNVLGRVVVAMMLFEGAYMSEVFRGSMRALPKGQTEGARSLGLGYWQTQFKVVLPQVLTYSIPGIINICIGAFKDTSLVLIVGLLDFLSTTKLAYANPQWTNAFVPILTVCALIYFLFCNGISSYGTYLEKRFRLGAGR